MTGEKMNRCYWCQGAQCSFNTLSSLTTALVLLCGTFSFNLVQSLQGYRWHLVAIASSVFDSETIPLPQTACLALQVHGMPSNTMPDDTRIFQMPLCWMAFLALVLPNQHLQGFNFNMSKSQTKNKICLDNFTLFKWLKTIKCVIFLYGY